MLTFIKRTATSWKHIYNGKDVSFGGGIPITNNGDNTIIFQTPNGTNFPTSAQLIAESKIIDETDGDAEYTFTTATDFWDKLVELNYPYIVTGGGGGGGTSYTDTTFAQFMQTLDAETEIEDVDLLNFTDDSQTKQKVITWSNFKGFLKEYLDTIYATASAVATAISEALTTANTYTDNALENYTTTTDLNNALGLKADTSLFLFQQSDRTLTSNTSAQNIFDVGVSGSGAITLLANSTYHFEMEMSMTGLSTTSGTISLSFDAGTANITLFKANVMASKATLNNNSTMQHTFMESTSVNPIVNASTVATAKVFVSGVLVCTTAGTFIPRVTMSQASASSVKAGSHLKMERLGSNTATHYPTS